MTFISPHINTLIVEVGSYISKVGYTGDFLPTYVFKTDNSCNNLSLTSCKILEEFLKKTSLDSFIFIEPDNFTFEMRIEILKYIFTNKLANSMTFLNCRVAEAFGGGKVTTSILSCSSSGISSSLVLNGKLSEFTSFGNGRVFLRDALIDEINKSDFKNEIYREINKSKMYREDASDKAKSKIYQEFASDEAKDLFLSSILESEENIDLLKIKYKIDFFAILRPTLVKSIEKIHESRKANCMNKKNASNGSILLTGGLFKYETFCNFVKSLILDKIGFDFTDFILRDKELINSFAGASVFGSNNQTKQMFITAFDWQSMGSEIVKLKSF